MGTPNIQALIADAAASDGWGFKVVLGLVGGTFATFVGFLLNQHHQHCKESIKEVRDYIVALQSAADELEFYGGKLGQLSSEMGAIANEIQSRNTTWIIPTYSIYPDFLEKMKVALSTFYRNPDLVKQVGHCHFELCHILARLDLIKTELRVPLGNDRVQVTVQLKNHLQNVLGFKGLLDLNIRTFSATRDAILIERSEMGRVLALQKERSLLSTED